MPPIIIRANTATYATGTVVFISGPVPSISFCTSATASPSVVSVSVPIIISIPRSWTAASGATPWLRNFLHNSSLLNPFSIGAVLGKLHHDIPPINCPPIKLVHGPLRLVLVLVPHEREPSRIPSPAVAGDVDVDDIAAAVKEREEVVSRRAEGDIEDEEGE